MTAYFPEGVSTIGRDGWWWLLAVANRAAANVAEVTAASVLNVNMAMRPGFGADADTPRIDDPRHGAQQTYESFGRTKRTLGEVTWIDRPQDANAAATAKHRDQITDSLVGFLMNRRGFGSAPENFAALALGQRYTLYPVQAGPQVEIASGADGGQFEYKQSFIVIGPVIKGAIVA